MISIEQACKDYFSAALTHALVLDGKDDSMSARQADTDVAFYEKSYPWLIQD